MIDSLGIGSVGDAPARTIPDGDWFLASSDGRIGAFRHSGDVVDGLLWVLPHPIYGSRLNPSTMPAEHRVGLIDAAGQEFLHASLTGPDQEASK